jgi:hypothetical protein
MTKTTFDRLDAKIPPGLWEASNYPGTTHAQVSKDSGLWHFGVADSPNGAVLVLEITQSRPECVAKTLAVADNYECHLVSGEYVFVTLVAQHVKNMMNKVSADEEYRVFMATAQKYYPYLDYTLLRSAKITATASAPEPSKYPTNIAKNARPVWDAVLKSKAYLNKSSDSNLIQKWGLVTRLFLDACNRKGVTPFSAPEKSKTLEALSTKYSEQRKLASSLERQVFYNMQANGLVEDLDRGVWSFHSVVYTNNRYAVVLQTRWLSLVKTPSVLVEHLDREEDFSVSNQGGLEHRVSPLALINVRIQKHPGIAVRMLLLLSKDLLLQLGVVGRNRDEMLEGFEDIAKDFARSRKFHKAKHT